MNLNGKTVLITGGSSGIGLDAIRQFSQLGARVITCGRSETRLHQAKNLFPDTEILRCDVTDEGDVLQLKQKVEALGGIDILYNNAGEQRNNTATAHGKGEIVTNAASEIQTNYLAVIRLNELFIPLLEQKPQPMIIITSSALAFVPAAAIPTYSASKAALHSYTRSLRQQLEKEQSKIKIYELMPPFVDTPFNTSTNPNKLQPSDVNKVLIKALGSNKFEIRPGAARALYFLHRMFPEKALKVLSTMG